MTLTDNPIVNGGADAGLANGMVVIRYVGKLSKGIHSDVGLVGNGSLHTCEVDMAARLTNGVGSEFEPRSSEDKIRIETFTSGRETTPKTKESDTAETHKAAGSLPRKTRRGGLESPGFHRTE